MIELFANSGDPDQILHSAASDLGLHCLPVILLGVSQLQQGNLTLSTKVVFVFVFFRVAVLQPSQPIKVNLPMRFFLYFYRNQCLAVLAKFLQKIQSHWSVVCGARFYAKKKAFNYVKNVQIHIFLHLRKVLSGPLLSFDTFCSSQWFWQQTVHLPSLIWAFAVCTCPEDTFSLGMGQAVT